MVKKVNKFKVSIFKTNLKQKDLLLKISRHPFIYSVDSKNFTATIKLPKSPFPFKVIICKKGRVLVSGAYSKSISKFLGTQPAENQEFGSFNEYEKFIEKTIKNNNFSFKSLFSKYLTSWISTESLEFY